MSIEETIKQFSNAMKLKLTSVNSGDIVTFMTDQESLIHLLNFVKDQDDLRFSTLTDIFAADFPARKKRFEVCYSLLSMKLNERILFKIHAEENETVPSAVGVFNGACWYEREIFDMYGVEFTNTHDLRRILTDYGFKGHPLRKDFPLTGHVEVRYDEKLKQVIYEPVVLDQMYRDFDFVSPWKGPGECALPGDEKATKD